MGPVEEPRPQTDTREVIILGSHEWIERKSSRAPKLRAKLSGDHETKEIAEAMQGYARIGVRHVMFQCELCTPEARRRLTEALQLYRCHGAAMRVRSKTYFCWN